MARTPDPAPPDDIPIPPDLPDDPAEAYRLGYARGASAAARETAERLWRLR